MRPPPHILRRCIHSTARARDLIGPIHPITNLRPIIYDDIPQASKDLASSPSSHPYSLAEFSEGKDIADYELRWRLYRQHVEKVHHNFWLDSNSRFEAGKAAVLSCLPETATQQDKEDALSEFYKQWVVQEKERTDAYTREWRRQNWAGIFLAGKVQYKRTLDRIFSAFSTKS